MGDSHLPVNWISRRSFSSGKRRKRMEITDRALAIAGDLHALASKNKDMDLQAKSRFELSDMVRLSDTVIAPRCRDIHTLAVANAAALAPYGVTPAVIAALDTAINDYTGLLTAPRQAVVGRKEVTGNLAEDEDSADSLLKDELDQAMRKFKLSNAPFHREYMSARSISDLGTRHEKPEPSANGLTTTPTPPTS
jgi:hypothetical protein